MDPISRGISFVVRAFLGGIRKWWLDFKKGSSSYFANLVAAFPENDKNESSYERRNEHLGLKSFMANFSEMRI